MEPCVHCGAQTTSFEVPSACRGLLDGDPETVRLCERCLTVIATTETAPDTWDRSQVSDALPTDPDSTVAVGMLVTLLSSLALHRRELETIVRYLEAQGVDPLLVLDRLAVAPEIELRIDPRRRRDQLAQLLSD